MAQERILVDVPDWIHIEEANVTPGDKYWRLMKVRYLNEHTSGGLHHIYSMEPHDTDVRLMVTNGHETWTVPHDKPAAEPAANFAMWAKNQYTVWTNGRGVTASDRISGFHMPFKLHVAFELWWDLVEAASDASEPDEEDLPTALLSAAEANQVIQFNPNAALQKVIFADGFVPNSPEFEVRVAGNTYIGQRAEHLGSGEVRVYYVKHEEWDHIQNIVRSTHEQSSANEG